MRWYAVPYERGGIVLHEIREQDEHQIDMVVADYVLAEHAPLISAAPDLLEACRAALAWMGPWPSTGDEIERLHVMAQLRAAIARATGEE